MWKPPTEPAIEAGDTEVHIVQRDELVENGIDKAVPVWAQLAVQRSDWKHLTEQQRGMLISWYASRYGLNPEFVCLIKVQGRLIPYIKAMGVLQVTRDKVKSCTVSSPTVTQLGGRAVSVSVTATVETMDGKIWGDIGAVRITDSIEVATMKAVTVARTRALRASIGLPLPSEGELPE